MLLVASVFGSAQQPRVYSMCDLFQSAMAPSPTSVSISGLVDGSPFHGYVLKETAVLSSCPTSRTGLKTAPAAALLIWDGGYGVSVSDSEKQTNQAVLVDLYSRYNRRDVGPYPFIVTGTVVFKDSPAFVRLPDGSFKGNGFGEMGAYPAIIVVRSAVAR